jgi:hypothetical protein
LKTTARKSWRSQSEVKHQTTIYKLPSLCHFLGEQTQFYDQVLSTAANASALREGIPVSVIDFKAGAGGVVSKLGFQDGICWSNKMFRINDEMSLWNNGVGEGGKIPTGQPYQFQNT